MPREIRPWYRPNTDRASFVTTLISGASLWGSTVVITRGYFVASLLFVPSVFILLLGLTGLWRERRPWVYETHTGRDIRVEVECERGQDMLYTIFIDDRFTVVYPESFKDDVGYGIGINFGSILNWRNFLRTSGGPIMTWDERVDVFNIMLDYLQSHGARVGFVNDNLPDTPQVRAVQEQLKKERSRIRST